MSEEIKNTEIALSDDELENVNGGVGVNNWLKDKKGGKKRGQARFKFNENAQEEAELRSNSHTPI